MCTYKSGRIRAVCREEDVVEEDGREQEGNSERGVTEGFIDKELLD